MKSKVNYRFGKKLSLLVLACCLLIPAAFAQEEVEEQDDHRPIRPPFESTWLIDNQTTIVPAAKTLQFDILHRFGTVNNGSEDLFGIFGPSNIRLGMTYTIIENLSVGFGTTKNQRLQDFNIKYALIKQTRSNKVLVSVTYFGNATLDSRDGDLFSYTSDRLSYFHQLIVSRKVSNALSIQVAPSLSHFNVTESNMKNDHIAIASGLRYKFSPVSSFMVNYDQPLTKHDTGNPNPNISFGVEITTSSHSFQIFMGNYQNLVPQYNNVFNSNDFRDGNFLIGFNITRLWNL